jgi:hypothetical protein
MVNFHQHRPGIAALFNLNVLLLIAYVKGFEEYTDSILTQFLRFLLT